MYYENCHVNDLRAGDCIYHNGLLRTVCPKDLTTTEGAQSVFGDSYRAGSLPVPRMVPHLSVRPECVKAGIQFELKEKPLPLSPEARNRIAEGVRRIASTRQRAHLQDHVTLESLAQIGQGRLITRNWHALMGLEYYGEHYTPSAETAEAYRSYAEGGWGAEAYRNAYDRLAGVYTSDLAKVIPTLSACITHAPKPFTPTQIQHLKALI